MLRQNRTDLIDLFVDSEQLLVGLAKQSPPTFVCTFRNFAGLIPPESRNIVGEGTKNPGVRVNLQFVNPRGRYLPNQDEPRFMDLDPPAVCYEPAKKTVARSRSTRVAASPTAATSRRHATRVRGPSSNSRSRSSAASPPRER